MRRHLFVAAALVAAVALVYGQTLGHGFVNWDDPGYILANVHTRQGLSWAQVGHAFSTFVMANWQPLSWLSMMADVSLFGLWAGGHHLVGLAWHAAAVVMLYAALVRLTGDAPRAALVAALFALHPLNVEPVAWAAQRKDLMCAFFWMLALWLYARHAAAPSWRRYAALLLAFVAALLSKPMAVSLPLVLLLIDHWPLARWRRATAARLLLEKLPLLALSLASAWITIVAQSAGGAVRESEPLALADRLAHLAVAYTTYALKIVWPADLSFFYVPRAASTATLLVAAGVAAALLAATVWFWRRRPWLGVGLAWFLIVLLPVIGVVRIGDQAWANRYAYLPGVGLFIALAWSVPVPAWPLRAARSRWQAAALAVLLGVAGLVAALETRHWKSSLSLFTRALEIDPGNHVAHFQLAEALVDRGQAEAAIQHLLQGLQTVPAQAKAAAGAGQLTLSKAYMATGRLDQAEAALDRAEALVPGRAQLPYNRGTLALLRNDPAAALPHFDRALALDPGYSAAHNNRGAAWARLGRGDQALAAYQAAVLSDPDNHEARFNLGALLERLGRTGEARRAFETLAERAPRHLPATLRAARLAQAGGDRAAARRWARQALSIDPNHPEARQLAAGHD